ncbi:hypothetical protein AB3S75_035404 [Citrus x aurantiifolia]
MQRVYKIIPAEATKICSVCLQPKRGYLHSSTSRDQIRELLRYNTALTHSCRDQIREHLRYNTALTHLISLIIKPVNEVTANRERKRPSMKERSLSA